jgi:hypothetical protein
MVSNPDLDRCSYPSRGTSARRIPLLHLLGVATLLAALLGVVFLPGGVQQAGTVSAQDALAAGCPDEGRDPVTVVVLPQTSSTYTLCQSSASVSTAAASGTTVASGRCPEWVVTGMSYNPVMFKPNYYILDQTRRVSLERVFHCRPVRVAWGLYSSIDCEVISETVFAEQVHVLRDRKCPSWSVDPS